MNTETDSELATRLAVEAGRDAFLAGRIPRKFAASPSSPMAGRIV